MRFQHTAVFMISKDSLQNFHVLVSSKVGKILKNTALAFFTVGGTKVLSGDKYVMLMQSNRSVQL